MAVEFNSPAAHAEYNKLFTKWAKKQDPKTLASMQEILRQGRDLVGWKATGRKVLEG